MEEYIYKKMYLFLFNMVTDVLEKYKDDPSAASIMLELGQLECERMYVEAEKKQKKKNAVWKLFARKNPR